MRRSINNTGNEKAEKPLYRQEVQRRLFSGFPVGGFATSQRAAKSFHVEVVWSTMRTVGGSSMEKPVEGNVPRMGAAAQSEGVGGRGSQWSMEESLVNGHVLPERASF